MRIFVVFVIGLLVGAGMAAAALYYNPLTQVAAPASEGEQWLSYGSPVEANLVLTHSGKLPIKKNPAQVPELWEGTIDGATLLLVDLRNADGSVFGVGTRISVLSEETELLRNGVSLASYWTVSAPGRGTFFVVERENIWPVLKEVVLPTVYFSQGWRGTNGYSLNAGPLASGHGLLLGATGEFRGQRGRALERYELRGYSASEGPIDMSAELGIILPPQTAVSESPAADAP